MKIFLSVLMLQAAALHPYVFIFYALKAAWCKISLPLSLLCKLPPPSPPLIWPAAQSPFIMIALS